VDLIYPAENCNLTAELVSKELILSEFAMGSTAFPQNFPIRNHIISGIGVGPLVVEEAQYSGSSITALLAIDQGREVFAVPGNITSEMSFGPNLLIKQETKLVQDWNDVVVDLPPEVRRRLVDEGKRRLLDQGVTGNDASSQANQASSLGSQGDISRRLAEKLKPDVGAHVDTLVEALEGFTTSELIAALFELEMTGLVKQLPGKNFVKVW
jgi:DNA processing protein